VDINNGMNDTNKNHIVKPIMTTGKIVMDNPLPPAKWRIWIVGGINQHRSIALYVQDEKNWFHRTMTKIFFGWKWERL